MSASMSDNHFRKSDNQMVGITAYSDHHLSEPQTSSAILVRYFTNVICMLLAHPITVVVIGAHEVATVRSDNSDAFGGPIKF